MYKTPNETDPLLPKYDSAPEINGHQQHSSEVHDPSYLSSTYTTDNSDAHPWKRQVSHREDSDLHGSDEEDVSAKTESTMGKFFRTVFTVIFMFCFFAIVVSFLGALHHSDDPQPEPPSWTRPRPAPLPHKTQKALEILQSTPLIDGHNDLAIFIRERYKNNITSATFRAQFENGSMPLNVDLPRMRDGHVGGAFWSAFVLCPVNASYDMTDANYATAVSHTLEQIDVLRRLQEAYPRDFTSIARASGSGRQNMLVQWHSTKSFFGPISIEGLHQIPPTAPMSTLRHYYELGVRMATLTWNCHNPFADATFVWNDFTTPPTVVNGVFRPEEGAITRRGRAVLQEMNRIGMIIDLSHTSYWTQKAVLTKGNGITRAPVVFSHSSAYSICPHPRNVRDDILDLVKESSSLVMVNFSPDFISCTPAEDTAEDAAISGEPHFSVPTFYEKNNTLHQVARHITYIGERVGYEHVGLGSDYDGMGELTPKGLEGVDTFPDLVVELLKMGVTEAQAKMVVGGNLLRVWKDVDDVAAAMKDEGVEPGLDDASGY